MASPRSSLDPGHLKGAPAVQRVIVPLSLPSLTSQTIQCGLSLEEMITVAAWRRFSHKVT